MPATFHVFLSHNSSDKPTVERIAKQLRDRELRVWLDKWELRPGLPWQDEIEKGIDASNAVAVAIGEGGLGPWEAPEMRAFIDRSRRETLPVIPVLLPGAPEKPDAGDRREVPRTGPSPRRHRPQQPGSVAPGEEPSI